jgi:hypothetical protein
MVEDSRLGHKPIGMSDGSGDLNSITINGSNPSHNHITMGDINCSRKPIGTFINGGGVDWSSITIEGVGDCNCIAWGWGSH